jgi:hypothetical protein
MKLMKKQTFVVTLGIVPPFDQCFPRVEAERLAKIIRDAVEARSCSFIGSVPFSISVERVDEAALASGEVPEYPTEEFEPTEETPRRLVKVLKKA